MKTAAKIALNSQVFVNFALNFVVTMTLKFLFPIMLWNLFKTYTSRYLLIVALTFGLMSITLELAAQSSPKSVITFPHSHAADIGVVVRDLATGEDIISENADKMLTPASIMKCVTAASVLLLNKENDCFITDSYITGNIVADTILIGDILIRGVGDPTLESQRFPEYVGFMDSIVSNVKQRGISRIAGTIEIDSIGFVEQGPCSKWELEDLKWSYGAGLFPLNYKENTLSGDCAMRDPALHFTKDLKAKLKASGISVDETEVGFGEIVLTPLYSHSSPSFAEIMRAMIEVSNNLYAESMVRTLEPENYLAAAIEREHQILENLGLDCNEIQSFDGSGLTRENQLTPRFMADLLLAMYAGEKSDIFIKLFPRAGEEGTVKKVLENTPLSGKFVLKSGSMRGVLCYAGYKLDDNGIPTHVIVVMANGFTCSTVTVRKAICNFLLKQFSE